MAIIVHYLLVLLAILFVFALTSDALSIDGLVPVAALFTAITSATVANVLATPSPASGHQSSTGLLYSSKSRARKKIEVNTRNTLECHRREYTYKATTHDSETDHKCWDFVTVESCWGRCDSGEIADYHFPFKKSYHYVCIHDNTELVQFRLGECTHGAPEELRLYETVVAKTCVCALCETASANCESYPGK